MSKSDAHMFNPGAVCPMTHCRWPISPHRFPLRHDQGGAIAIMFALLLIPILGVCALALDLAMVYNRQAEMHSLARSVAISAARRLNGSPAGISDAVNDAAATASVTRFKNHSRAIAWSSAALRFSSTPARAGTWLDATSASAAATAPGIYYVKVDTAALAEMGVVNTALARILSPSLATVTTSSDAIAGRTDIAVAPLAICAMSTAPAASRPNGGAAAELVQYGFRRGISYDLVNLNPNGLAALSFVINPLARPGSTGLAANLDTSTVGPYACSGTLGIPGLTGGALAVASPFPLGSLYRQLNSRFDQYDGDVCHANGAPPDSNIKAYDYTGMVTPLQWTTKAVQGQTATMYLGTSSRSTYADLPYPGGTVGQYGPVWAYAKAVSYASYLASPVEPEEGYTGMATTVWPSLYNTQGAKISYPVTTPYNTDSGVTYAPPGAAHAPGIRNRRVLNVALLNCSTTPASSATVLAVGKFFMTVPATSSVLAAEFAGTVPFDRLGGKIGVFQ
ncbi:pilus assembly protein TadG-related protein [Massilia sp. DWR3-1-1]|uniref:pilus assembly protein TadG-related protein n=1 Tax=Massilia sp. DWR3-1-1 TaxID=2804559 RepID=UPI003CEC4521